jgi:pyridoxine 5-phosphate synthase
MAILFVGLDHLAALRQAGVARDPDPVIAAGLAELAGAGGITITLGRERTGMQERDLRLLRETARAPLNVCLPPQDEWVKLALAVRPDLVTLVPETREGLGAERGLDVEDRRGELARIIEMLKSAGIPLSVLVEAAPGQVKAAQRAGTAAVQLHTGRFCWADNPAARAAELDRLVNAAKLAHKLGLTVHAGGGLGPETLGEIAPIAEIGAVHVGHAFIARALLVGISEAVRHLLRILSRAGGQA